MNLLKDPYTITKENLSNEIITNNLIKNKENILTYLEDKDYHSTLYCTFYEIFIKVYGRIIFNINKDDLFQRLNEEMSESDCMCYSPERAYTPLRGYTGRLSRLVNVLNGYYDDIIINISDNESAGSIAQQIIARRRRDFNDEAISWNEETINEIKTTLEERGFSNEVITAWTTDL